MDTFKGLHAVINPAGILRDSMFHKMTDADWDMVVNVHLNGAYNVTRQTINHFREQGEGAYVLFTSTSGLIGNIGQANYAAVKLGVVGLSRIIAMEGRGQERALQHHRALRLVAHDRDHPGEGRSLRQARRADEELHARRPGGAARGQPRLAGMQGGERPDLHGARQRDLPDEPAAAGARPGKDRRAGRRRPSPSTAWRR
ncbi:MAG: SDR family NAD(P)-dependent oxidoreductase [Rhizomicrobium sp.]